MMQTDSAHWTPDLLALEQYLSKNMPSFKGPIALDVLSGGASNPSYRMKTPSGTYVLRTRPGPRSSLLPSAHAVDREFKVIAALANSDVPVPAAFWLCQDEEVLGREFMVMGYVDGRVFWDPSLPGLRSEERSGVFEEMNRVLAALHSIDVEARGLAGFGKPGNYFSRQISRWTHQYKSSETDRIPAMDRLIDWLPEHVPPDQGECALVHGDYRLDNMIFHKEEPRVLAVLDWELSTLGHPLADLSYQCMAWHIPYGLFRGIKGLDLQSLGIPSEEDYVHAYCKKVSRQQIEHWNFYLAYNFFRISAIIQGIKKRTLDGVGSSPLPPHELNSIGALASLGWGFAQQTQ